MESLITIATALVVLYILLKVANSAITTTLVDVGTDVITVNSKEIKLDAEQRLYQKMVKLNESGKSGTAAQRIALEVQFGLTKSVEEL